MMSSRTRAGGERIAERGNKPLKHDVVKLLKTQDAGYLRMQLQKTQVARHKLEQEVALWGSMDAGAPKGPSKKPSGPIGKHVVFVDSVQEQHEWTDEEPSGSEQPRGNNKEASAERKKRRLRIERKRNLLEALKAREADLQQASTELDMQRAKMNNAIGSTTKAGKKFKVRERKR